MGQVLNQFLNGSVGAISRSLDDVVVALANKAGEALSFGIPVALDENKSGVVKFDPESHTGADFVGVTVRNPSKTPDTYGSNTGSYGAGDMVDVLVRGHIVAKVGNRSGKLGDAVAIRKSDGVFAVGTGEDYVELPNVRLSQTADAYTNAELLLTERNVL